MSVPDNLQGQQVRCPKCSQVVTRRTNVPSPEVADPFANLETSIGTPSPFMAPASTPTAKKTSPSRTSSYYRSYAEVPWLRKSGTHTVFFVLHLLSFGILPFLLITCVVLVTGPVFYNQQEANGTLKTWSSANTIVAFLLLIPSLLVIGLFGVAFVGGVMRAFAS
ncbi:hypothetical protein LOC67_17660 [Stieleria sp. JC731]|uniref:hypothetical protein n=1 Tax=Pirellulaceae TaxID=2691357 RepID=UPI001E35CCD0|nr:hypothetical protein [Stieleria sp. JC731]MCC9602380.1 hypothetical protein [Stieleria sp. JC731]